MAQPVRPQVISISPASADFDARAKKIHAQAFGEEHAERDEGEHSAPPRWIQTFLSVALALVIVASLAIAAALAIAHARDRYWINIASSSWVALAWNAEHGVLYPPLRDDTGNFGGTRYMPLHVLAHAALSRVTGEFLLSGRIIGYASAAMWFAAIVALVKQRGARSCPWVIAGALAASVLASPVGIQALCTIRSDGLALALQLWALWIIGRSERPMSATFAAILCALGFLAKLTAVWAALAIGLWLLWRNRKSLLAFVGVGLAVAGASLVIVNYMTDGRLLANFSASGGAGWRGWGAVVVWSQQRMLGFVNEWSPTTWMLVPAAALALLLAASRRELNVIHLAWVSCCATLAVMFADVGVGENHILELAAITAVCAGDLWARAARRSDESPSTSISPAWSIAQLLLATAVGWSSQAVIKQRLMRDSRAAIEQLRSGATPAENDPHGLDELLAGKRFLSDDPLPAILQNQRPIISDAFLFRGFGEAHSDWHDELIARITNREFDVILLTAEAEPDSWWYRELFLGEPVMSAIVSDYRLSERRAGYWVYRPASSPG